MPGSSALAHVVARVGVLRAGYRPPRFEHIPDPDAAIFFCAVDHRSGYRAAHSVGAEGPLEGSELLWAVGLRAAAAEPGLLSAAGLADVSAGRVERLFAIDGETVAGAGDRAALWRDLAGGLATRYGGEAGRLLAAADRRLGGVAGLLTRLADFEAYSDPLAKKAQLYAKICERRGWLEVVDPDQWQVSADNVLMRLALRSGLVEPGGLDRVRAATRDAFKAVSIEAGISPPVLDDMLWELGRADADLLGNRAGELREPERDLRSTWY